MCPTDCARVAFKFAQAGVVRMALQLSHMQNMSAQRFAQPHQLVGFRLNGREQKTTIDVDRQMGHVSVVCRIASTDCLIRNASSVNKIYPQKDRWKKAMVTSNALSESNIKCDMEVHQLVGPSETLRHST